MGHQRNACEPTVKQTAFRLTAGDMDRLERLRAHHGGMFNLTTIVRLAIKDYADRLLPAVAPPAHVHVTCDECHGLDGQHDPRCFVVRQTSLQKPKRKGKR